MKIFGSFWFASALLVWSGTGLAAQTKEQEESLMMMRTRQALQMYYEHMNHFPTPAQGLASLWANPGEAGWKGPYAFEKDLGVDLWGRPFLYLVTGNNSAIFSAGPDKTFATYDDLSVLVQPFAKSVSNKSKP